jgi:hypothetical protein
VFAVARSESGSISNRIGGKFESISTASGIAAYSAPAAGHRPPLAVDFLRLWPPSLRSGLWPHLTERLSCDCRRLVPRMDKRTCLRQLFRHDLKRECGQHRQNRLRDDRVRREEQGVEFDRATLPRYPDPLHALTVFIRFHNLCLRQEVVEMVVGRQRDLVLLQVATGCRQRARNDYSGFVARDINWCARGIDPQPAARDQVPQGADELVNLAVGSLQHPVWRGLLDALLIERAHETRQRGRLVSGVSADKCGHQFGQPLQTDEPDIGGTQEIVQEPWGELGMTAVYPLLIPFQHRRHFDLSQKLGVGLV